MPHADYIKNGDLPFSAQLNTFETAIPAYAAALKVPAASVTAQAADADYFAYVLQCAEIMKRSSQQWTAWKNILRKGGTPPAILPEPPAFPAAVAAVAPGVEGRFRALAGQITKATGCTDAIREALDILGPEQTGPDYATIQPVIEAHVSGNRVEIKWGWQGMGEFLDLCELQVDRTGGGTTFAPLAFDTTPGYVDTAPFPAAPVKWTYRAIYRKGDNQVGLGSNPVSVAVGG